MRFSRQLAFLLAVCWLAPGGASAQPPPDPFPLHRAAQQGDLTALEQFLGSERAAGRAPLLDARDQDGNTALMAAARAGHTAIVNRLLNAGAGADLRNPAGFTARQLAENANHPMTVAAIDGQQRDREQALERIQHDRERVEDLWRMIGSTAAQVFLLPIMALLSYNVYRMIRWKNFLRSLEHAALDLYGDSIQKAGGSKQRVIRQAVGRLLRETELQTARSSGQIPHMDAIQLKLETHIHDILNKK